MKKSMVLLLLWTALITSFLPSCAGDTAQEETVAQSQQDTVRVETETARASHKVPELDFGGATYTTSYLDWQEYAEYFFAHESTGDAMNDAIYERTVFVEETLNITMAEMSYAENNSAGQISALKASIQSGDDAYQTALMHCFDALMTEGYLYPVDTLPYVDLDSAWWNRDAMDSLRANKHYYYCVSDYTIPVPFAIYFNKDMVVDYSLENPYTLVKEGTWTMDAMFDMRLTVAQDVDGDGKYSDGDVVGIAAHSGSLYVNFMNGAGQFVGTRDENDKITIDMNNERMISIVEKLCGYMIQPCAAVDTPESSWDDPFGMLGGKVLFRLNSIAMGHHYRDVEENIGILPYPKYDEEQKEYISLNWGGLMGIPASIQNTEMVGAVLELLAWNSAETVIPAYYDVMLDGKLARDEDSVAMLDLLFASFVYDPGLNLVGSKSGVSNLVWTMNTLVVGQKSTDFASYYAKNEKAALASIEAFYEAMDKLDS